MVSKMLVLALLTVLPAPLLAQTPHSIPEIENWPSWERISSRGISTSAPCDENVHIPNYLIELVLYDSVTTSVVSVIITYSLFGGTPHDTEPIAYNWHDKDGNKGAALKIEKSDDWVHIDQGLVLIKPLWDCAENTCDCTFMGVEVSIENKEITISVTFKSGTAPKQ